MCVCVYMCVCVKIQCVCVYVCVCVGMQICEFVWVCGYMDDIIFCTYIHILHPGVCVCAYEQNAEI